MICAGCHHGLLSGSISFFMPLARDGGYMRRAMAAPERQPSLHERLKEINNAGFSGAIGMAVFLTAGRLRRQSAFEPQSI